MALYSETNKVAILKVDWFAPTSRLAQIINPEEQTNIMLLKPVDHIVDMSKLRNFMQVNEMVAVASHPQRPTESMVVLPQSELKKLGYNTQLAGTYLFVLYLHSLPARPFFKSLERTDSGLNSWESVTEFLNFPEKLLMYKSTAEFLIYGHSDLTEMLRKATKMLKPKKPANPSIIDPAYILMFDRQNDSLFNKQLRKHKKMPSTQIWEYGVPNLSYGGISPPRQVFPFGSGGFVMTDMKNMIEKPSIIQTIIQEMKKV